MHLLCQNVIKLLYFILWLSNFVCQFLLLRYIDKFEVSLITELRIIQKDNSHVYNHTLAMILVEYASAVS